MYYSNIIRLIIRFYLYMSSLANSTLRQLRTFAAVAKHGSFSAAAAALHITQPAVSMQVRELETHCGIALHERVGRRIELTEAGREVAACGAAIDDQLRQTEERIAQMLGLVSGVLSLDAVSTAKYFAPALLAAFQQAFPAITVRFSVGNREEIVRRLAQNECDLVIMGRPPGAIDVHAEPFSPHPLVFVAASTHPLVKRRRVRLQQLVDEKLLIRETGSGTRAAMEELFASKGLSYTASMEVSSNETIKQAVIAGMGIAFLSAHTLGSELQTRRLRIIDTVGLPVMREWHVVHRANKRLSPIAAAFLEFLLDQGDGIISATVAHGGAQKNP